MSSSKPENDRAVAAGLRYVRSGARSTREALTYLARRGVAGPAAAEALREWKRRGLLDDRACARLWAEHWSRLGYAWAAIREKLSAKGLDEPAIDSTAVRWGRASDDDARARRVAARIARRSPPRAARPRVARALASRGFDSDVIERILEAPSGSVPQDAE